MDCGGVKMAEMTTQLPEGRDLCEMDCSVKDIGKRKEDRRNFAPLERSAECPLETRGDQL